MYIYKGKTALYECLGYRNVLLTSGVRGTSYNQRFGYMRGRAHSYHVVDRLNKEKEVTYYNTFNILNRDLYLIIITY